MLGLFKISLIRKVGLKKLMTRGMLPGFGLACLTAGKDTLDNVDDDNYDSFLAIHYYNESKVDHGHH